MNGIYDDIFIDGRGVDGDGNDSYMTSSVVYRTRNLATFTK